MFQYAKSLGDYLIVGIDSDESFLVCLGAEAGPPFENIHRAAAAVKAYDKGNRRRALSAVMSVP